MSSRQWLNHLLGPASLLNRLVPWRDSIGQWKNIDVPKYMILGNQWQHVGTDYFGSTFSSKPQVKRTFFWSLS